MKEFSFHAALKQVMQMLGMPGGRCRLPLTGLSKDEVKRLQRGLQSIGFFDWCGHGEYVAGQTI